MPTKLLVNLETDVACTNSNMLGITDTEIYVANIRTICNQNAEVIGWNEIACRITSNNSNKVQSHMTERESL